MLSKFKIQSNKILIISIIVLCVIVSVCAFLLIDNCHGDGIGCIVLVPFYAVSLPALPVISGIRKILESISYEYYSFYIIPSFVTFIPLIIISTYTFLLGYFVSAFFIKLRSQQETPEEKSIKMLNVRSNFLAYYLLFLVLVCGIRFALLPPVPFASSKSVSEGCFGSKECIVNYIQSQAANCNKETSPFLYPLKSALPENDSCVFNNFTKNNPFQKYPLGRNMEIVLSFFDKASSLSSDEQKNAFCESFYDANKRQSDRDLCMGKLKLKSVVSSQDNERCLASLTDTSVGDLYNSCLDLLVGFKIYNPTQKTLSWLSSSVSSRLIVLDKNLMKIDRPVENKVIPSKYDFYYNAGVFGVSSTIWIEEVSINNPIYNNFINSIKEGKNYTSRLFGSDNYDNLYTKRQDSIKKLKIDTTDVYLEYVKIGKGTIFNEGNNWVRLHFVKGETYIVVNIEERDDVTDETRESLLIQVATSILESERPSAQTISTGSKPSSVFVSGNFAYVTNIDDDTMSVIDISNPASALAVSNPLVGKNPSSVFVSGNFAYVTNSGDNTMSIIDITNPKSPVVVSAVETGLWPLSVFVSGNHAYVANTYGRNVSVIDITNPKSPVVVSDVETGEFPSYVVVSGNYVYTTSSGDDKVSVIDISNPKSPIIVSTVKTGQTPTNIFVYGNYAYVTNTSGKNVSIIDITNPKSPVNVSTVETGLWPESIFISGAYAYVTNSGEDKLSVIDISNPKSPVVVSSVETGDFPYSIFVSGNYAYIVNQLGNTVSIIDISKYSSQN